MCGFWQGIAVGVGVGVGLGLLGLGSGRTDNSDYLVTTDALKYRALVAEFKRIAALKESEEPPSDSESGIMRLVAKMPYDMCGYQESPRQYLDKPIGFCWKCGIKHEGGQVYPFDLFKD